MGRALGSSPPLFLRSCFVLLISVKFMRSIYVKFIQGVSKKNVPNTKSLLIRYLQSYGYQQQPKANIGHQVCISVNFLFICSIL